MRCAASVYVVWIKGTYAYHYNKCLYLWCCHHSRAIARVHPVHLMNIERRQAAADPQTKPNDLDRKSACRLPESTPTIATYYYYSAQKLILILPFQRAEGG